MVRFYTIFLGLQTQTGANDWGLMEKTGADQAPQFRLLLRGTRAQCESLADAMNEEEKNEPL